MSEFVTIQERDCPEPYVEVRVQTHDNRTLTLVAVWCPFSGQVAVETKVWLTMPSVSTWTCPVCGTEHREEDE